MVYRAVDQQERKSKGEREREEVIETEAGVQICTIVVSY